MEEEYEDFTKGFEDADDSEEDPQESLDADYIKPEDDDDDD